MSDGFQPDAFQSDAFQMTAAGPTVRDRRLIPLLRRRTSILAPPLKGRLWILLRSLLRGQFA